jgi:hypothetical protein
MSQGLFKSAEKTKMPVISGRRSTGGPTLPPCEVSGVLRKTHARPKGEAVPMIDRRPGQKTLANDDTGPVILAIKRR